VADTRTAGVAGDTKLLPKWLSDIERLLPVRSQFVLSGAIRDLVLLRTGTALAPVPLLRALWATLKDLGFEFMLVHDPVDGVRIYPAERDVIARAVELLPSVTFQNGRAPAQINGMLIEIMRAIVGLRQARGAFVLDFASRLVPSPTQLEEQHRQFFAACEKLSLEASPALPQGASNGPLFNPVFWLLNRAQDLPSWLMLDSERISTHTVPDILMRSVMGLTGAHAKSGGSRPRGVLFFAGPTGVGKTESGEDADGNPVRGRAGLHPLRHERVCRGARQREASGSPTWIRRIRGRWRTYQFREATSFQRDSV
jgi:hypothetical protein